MKDQYIKEVRKCIKECEKNIEFFKQALQEANSGKHDDEMDYESLFQEYVIIRENLRRALLVS